MQHGAGAAAEPVLASPSSSTLSNAIEACSTSRAKLARAQPFRCVCLYPADCCHHRVTKVSHACQTGKVWKHATCLNEGSKMKNILIALPLAAILAACGSST